MLRHRGSEAMEVKCAILCTSVHCAGAWGLGMQADGMATGPAMTSVDPGRRSEVDPVEHPSLPGVDR